MCHDAVNMLMDVICVLIIQIERYGSEGNIKEIILNIIRMECILKQH